MPRAAASLALLLFPLLLRGQVYFNHLGKANGLPQINVVSIYQDETGAMWFGTISGLCRYNGNSTRVFHASPQYPGLTKNNVLSITGNGRGAVYIKADYDLIRYDIATDRFRKIGDGVTGMFYGGGRLWFNADGKIFTWSEERGAVALHADTPDVAGGHTALCVSPVGEVWSGGSGGLVVVGSGDGEKRPRRILDGENVYSLFIDSEGLVWVGTRDGGLWALDARGNVKWSFRRTPGGVSDGFIRTIAEDENGVIWIGTSMGLDSYDKRSGTWTNHRPDETQPGSLSDYSVFAVYRDTQNTMWVGTYYGGVSYFNPQLDVFSHYNASQTKSDKLSHQFVGRMVQDADDNLWICTDGGGLNCLDLRTRRFTRYFYEKYDPDHIPLYHIKSICLDPETGKLYMGVYGVGLWVFDTRTRKGTLYKRYDMVVLDMQLWHGGIVAKTDMGLHRLDTENDRLVPFSDDRELMSQVNGDYIYSFFIDSRDRLWLSTTAGLKCIDLRTKTKREYVHYDADPRSFGRSTVMSFVETSCGELFMGTLGSGLFRYEPATDDFDRYTEQNKAQLSDFSYHISETGGGNLLILHNNAFSIFDPRKRAEIYRSADNFPLSGFFDGNSSYVTSDGEIFIGGVNGLASVRESLLSEATPSDYKLYFDKLSVNGHHVLPGDGTGILAAALPLTDEMTLRHDRNNISVEFATSDYSRPRGASGYEYRLEGVDEEWTAASSHTITYTSLRAGRHTLVVREADPDKPDGAKKSRSLTITVRPPFWLTLFARIVYALLSVSLVAGIIFFSMWRYRMRATLEMERREKENIEGLNRMKLGFFTNVSHEFRTPLTLIMAQIEHLASAGGFSEAQRLGISKVYDNATHMRDLISELLDFRKAEQGFQCLKVERVDLSEYVGTICRSFTEYAAKHGIRYRYDTPAGGVVEAYVDRAQLKKAIFNLLSNAFKYTFDGGEITVSLRVDELIHILVEDNGIGISSEALSRVFERFYQVEYRTSGFSLGTGIGLAFTKEIIEGHRGEISVRSAMNKGSVFEIKLQKGHAHFDAGEFVQQQTAPTMPEVPVGTAPHVEVPVAAPPAEVASILIVEDNEELLSLLSEIFADEYTVLAAENGWRGLEMAEEHLPDLILTDVMMPEMSGKEMCRRIKSDTRLSHIPVVMLTALDSVDETVDGYMFGADDYVAKPFNVEILRARCGAIVRGRRQLYRAAARNGDSTAVEVRSEQDRLFIEKVSAIVRANFDNPDFDMDMLASGMCMGRTIFYARMKEVSGMTPNEFALSTKLRESTVLLRGHLHLNISEIADRLGFSSTNYFSKCFKTFYGTSPLSWRKENTKDDTGT